MHKFKLIIGIKTDVWGEKGLEKPQFFSTIEELKEYYYKREKEIISSGKKIWFAKVWEFGKEDYHDMDIELKK